MVNTTNIIYLTNSFSLLDLIPFLVGIVLGFILCILTYVLVVFLSIKKESMKVDKIEVLDSDVNYIIENYKNKYFEESSDLKTYDKIGYLKSLSWDLINDIAKMYYPDSKYPLYELTVEEFINLDYYIMKRIEKVFSGKILSKIKKMRISSVLKLIDMKKKYDENKLIKGCEKLKVKSIFKTVMTTINLLNPIYWVRRLMFDVPYKMMLNKISSTVIEIIGVETNNIYSKKAFSYENIDEEIKEIEKMIGDDNNE